MKKTKQEIQQAIERAKAKVRQIEAKEVTPEKRAESAFLSYAYDLIDRTCLAIFEELVK